MVVLVLARWSWRFLAHCPAGADLLEFEDKAALILAIIGVIAGIFCDRALLGFFVRFF